MRRALMLLALAALASCDSTPVDMAGDYTLAVTNRDNGCGFQSWVVGDNSTGIPLTITQAQNSHDVTAILEGATGVWVQTVLGDKTFTGTVSGDKMDVTLYGTRQLTIAGTNCTYTVNAEAVATLANDALAGSIDYKPATNGSPDCSSIAGCVSTQAFNGTRPPQ